MSMSMSMIMLMMLLPISANANANANANASGVSGSLHFLLNWILVSTNTTTCRNSTELVLIV
ncbi:hypothetical protein Fmac_003679 [Flemingia macrophylla]|uniref:Secreted protein n=1 Tax=Flemingia macrophylla TaxID=520843 RepID=A0ABD1N2R2_9FABA